MTHHNSQRSIPMIRFLIPLALQSLIILAVPAQAIYTHLSGQTVFLKTAPVDPYDPLRGYSVTLGYEVSRYEVLKTLPGWKEIPKGGQNWRSGKADPNYPKDDTIIYVTIEPTSTPTPKKAMSQHPAWQPIAVSLKMPNLAPHQAVLRGRLRYGRLESGLETYYMPESRRNEVNEAIRTQPSFLEAKVDRAGNATPVKLWVGDRAYEF
jgi:uncharacterized membrane-anchored protein